MKLHYQCMFSIQNHKRSLEVDLSRFKHGQARPYFKLVPLMNTTKKGRILIESFKKMTKKDRVLHCPS